MDKRLISVGLDLGTTSTQMVVSELAVRNRAPAFSVPELDITERTVRYRSPVYFTPLLEESRMDAAALRRIVEREYEKAGITRNMVDTGAVIVTGETSRRENARAVMEALADLAGDFVVTTAGPDLESLLAAQGSGAVRHSEKMGETVLHMDIGGGTANLCLIKAGKSVKTGCLNVGGRLVKYDEKKTVSYISPVLRGICALKVGQTIEEKDLLPLAQCLAQALEAAAGRAQKRATYVQLLTEEAREGWEPPQEPVSVSFSGGVADCIREDVPWDAYGDLGPTLGRCLRESALCRGRYLLLEETIRATVIGAGCHSAQLSGSTIFHRNVAFPLKNQRVLAPEEPGEGIRVLEGEADYASVLALAEKLARQPGDGVLVCLERDMAQALGQALALRLGPGIPILCIDRVRAAPGAYLDIGAPVGSALPVVVKTLAFG